MALGIGQINNTFRRVSANSSFNRVRYAMDEIEMDILKGQAEQTGQFLNPAYYDNAIAQLQALLTTTANKQQKQDIQARIYRYQVTKKSLLDRIAGSGVEENVDDTLRSYTKDYIEQESAIKSATMGNPVAYAQLMRDRFYEIEEGTGEEIGYIPDIVEKISDYRARTGKNSTKLLNQLDSFQQEFQKWQEIATADDVIRSKYGTYYRTNAYGEVIDFGIFNRYDVPSGWGNARQIGDWSVNGMPVMLDAQPQKDEMGNPIAIVPGQEQIIAGAGADTWDAPKIISKDDFLGNVVPESSFRPSKGAFIRVGGKDVYRYGGVSGEDEKWYHVANEKVMTTLGGFGQPFYRNYPTLSDFYEEAGLDETKVGVLNQKSIVQSRRQELMESLQEYGKREVEFAEKTKTIWRLPELAYKGIKRAGEAIPRETVLPIGRKPAAILEPGAIEKGIETTKGILKGALEWSPFAPKKIKQIYKAE